MPPMANELSDDWVKLTERHIAHYEKRAKSGVGAGYYQHAISSASVERAEAAWIYDDGLLPGLKEACRGCKEPRRSE